MKQSKIIHGVARNIEHGKTYTLHIAKDLLLDQEGNTLEKDIEIGILIEEDPEAYFSLIGSEKSYTGLGQMESDPYSVHENLFLTTEPKTFEIDFTKEVNTKSVEQSISKGLGDKAQVKFEWADTKRLKLYVDKLVADTEYLLSMKSAVDQKGYPIIGNLFFRVNAPNQLCMVNIKDNTTKVLKEFRDKSYMIWPAKELGKLFILDDTQQSYLFDTEKEKITILHSRAYGLGFPGLDWSSNWLDPTTVLYRESTEKDISIFTEKLTIGQKNKLFELPSQPVFYDALLSPDKQKIAFTSDDLAAFMNIYVYSLDGKMLYTFNHIASGEGRKVWPTTIYIQWLDEDNLVFIDNDDVVKLNIATGKKETLLRNATKPVTFPGKGIVLAQGKDPGKPRSLLFTPDGVKEVLPGNDLSNVNFISTEEFIFNIEEDIYIYNLKEDKKKRIGIGYILGLSPDKKTVYYLTNYDNLYFHLDW
ncbi:TolB family protein [Dehalobacter sp. TBBPA1]|uniref:TolB family protein n=1 Tax=Dehalobacter sp. TBBPA1 TaxID=3235037 RepID=UPI0034A0E271